MHIFSHNYKSYSFLGFLFSVAITLVIAVLPIYLDGLGFTDSNIGLIFSVFPLAIIIAMPFIGHIADVVGKRNVIIMAMIAEIVAVVLYIVDANVLFIILGRILEAIAAMTLILITLAKTEDSIRNNRGEKSGIFLSISSFGKIIAAPIAILIADFFFIQAPFMTSIAIIGLLLALLLMKKEVHFKKIHKKDFDYVANIRKYLSFRELRGMAILGGAMHAAHLPVLIFLPLFVINGLGQPLENVSYILFLLSIPMIIQFFFGKVADKYRPNNIVFLGVLVHSIGMMMIFFVNDIYGLALSVVVMGFGASMWNVSAWHLMSNIGEKIKGEGLVVTSYIGLASIGALIASVASGYIVENYSFQIFSFAAGIVILLSGMYTYFKFLRK